MDLRSFAAGLATARMLQPRRRRDAEAAPPEPGDQYDATPPGWREEQPLASTPDQAVERVDVELLTLPCPSDAELAEVLSVPDDADHKYTRGVVGLWAGSEAYPGAAVLVASAAVRAGAGMVRLVAPRRVEDLVLSARPEVVMGEGRCQALVLGPGTDPADPGDPARADELRRGLARAVAEATPAVIDAGALPLVAELVRDRDGAASRLSPCHVLTPHAGEAAQLLRDLGEQWERQEVEERALEAAASLVALTGATVVLKGTPTLVACPLVWCPQGRDVVSEALGLPDARPQVLQERLRAVPGYEHSVGVWALDSGPGWLATAGSGDVLAGILGALLAGMQARVEGAGGRAAREPFLEPAVCAGLAVRIHALAGQEAASRAAGGEAGPCGGGPIAALDVAEAVPGVVARLLRAERGPADADGEASAPGRGGDR